jgi:hypothetical protein
MPMAQVRLDRYELEEGLLPAVCMRCGAPATLTKAKTFAWHPTWIDTLIILGLICFTPLLLVGIVVAISMTKRMRVPAPLCHAHQNHWSWRAAFIWGGLGVIAFLGIGTFVFLMNTGQEDESLQVLAGWMCGAAGLIGLIWLIAAAIVQAGAIRASEITDDRIALIGVSPAFVEAVKRERDEAEEPFDDVRPRQRRPRPEDAEGFYDPDVRRPGHPPPDAYQAGDK